MAVSNLEKESGEILLADRPMGSGIVLLEPRDVPLGGPRAMSVRRTLPQRGRSLIGAWCFVDHYGPDDVARGRGMVVPPHPHTGLQTVSWLFAGEVEHRDSVGSHLTVRSGEVNLMTAGRGIQHSEVSLPDTTVLHGAQLWLALPDESRHTYPSFEHFVPEAVSFGAASVRVFLGSLGGQSSPVHTFTATVGAQIDLPDAARLELPVDAGFEHGILVDRGTLIVDGVRAPRGTLVYLPTGLDTVAIEATGDSRILLIGGEPLGEQIVMWWNFIGRSHEEIVEFRAAWQSEVSDGGSDAGRFGIIEGYDGSALPAPTLPTVRLKPRS